MQKLVEETQGTHIFMRMVLDNKRVEEIDVYLRDDGEHYHTSADNGAELDKTEEEKKARLALRNEIIRTFNELY
jgi:hypothetical protein